MYVIPLICCSCIYGITMEGRLNQIKSIMQFERNEVQFYTMKLKMAASPQEEQIITSVINCKKRHAIYLSHLYRELTGQDFTPNKVYADGRKPHHINTSRETKEFTLEELSRYDGSNRKDAYVAVDGIVYDVSNMAGWGGGTHFGLYSGRDLTAQFKSCHGMTAILDKLPRVGVLKV